MQPHAHAGELLAQLERSKGGDSRSFQPGMSVSEYNTVLTENDIAPVTLADCGG